MENALQLTRASERQIKAKQVRQPDVAKLFTFTPKVTVKSTCLKSKQINNTYIETTN